MTPAEIHDACDAIVKSKAVSDAETGGAHVLVIVDMGGVGAVGCSPSMNVERVLVKVLASVRKANEEARRVRLADHKARKRARGLFQ